MRKISFLLAFLMAITAHAGPWDDIEKTGYGTGGGVFTGNVCMADDTAVTFGGDCTNNDCAMEWDTSGTDAWRFSCIDPPVDTIPSNVIFQGTNANPDTTAGIAGVQDGGNLLLIPGSGTSSITIADFTQCASESFEGWVALPPEHGHAIGCVEGFHWAAGGTNDAAATSLASCLDAYDGITVAAVGAVITVTVDTGGYAELDRNWSGCSTMVYGFPGAVLLPDRGKLAWNNEIGAGPSTYITADEAGAVDTMTLMVNGAEALVCSQYNVDFHSNWLHNFQSLTNDDPDFDFNPYDTLISPSNGGYLATGSNRNGGNFMIGVGGGALNVTIDDWNNCAGDDITLYVAYAGDTISTITFTEGVDWTAGTSNDATAESLKDAIVLHGAMVDTVANAGVVGFVVIPAYHISLVTESDATCTTISQGTSGAVFMPDGVALGWGDGGEYISCDNTTASCLIELDGEGLGMSESAGNITISTTSGDLILAPAGGDLDVKARVYNSTAALNLGTAAATGHTLATGDVLVGGKLEVDGVTYFDGVVTASPTAPTSDIAATDSMIAPQPPYPTTATTQTTGGDLVACPASGLEQLTGVTRAATTGDTITFVYTYNAGGQWASATTTFTEGTDYDCDGAASDAACVLALKDAIDAHGTLGTVITTDCLDATCSDEALTLGVVPGTSCSLSVTPSDAVNTVVTHGTDGAFKVPAEVIASKLTIVEGQAYIFPAGNDMNIYASNTYAATFSNYGIEVAQGHYYKWANRGRLFAYADGQLHFTRNAQDYDFILDINTADKYVKVLDGDGSDDATLGVYQLVVGGNLDVNGQLSNGTNTVTCATGTDDFDINWNDGNIAFLDLGGCDQDANDINAPTNPIEGTSYSIVLKNGAGTEDVTWNAAFLFPGGVDPALTQAASARDVVSCLYVDSVYHCTSVQDFQ